MIHWAWIVIDRPEPSYDESVRFWSSVTGTRAEPVAASHPELTRLTPSSGDASVILQLVAAGPPGAHLDLAVSHLGEAVAAAQAGGASVEAEHGGWTVLRSPGGMPFCLLPGSGPRGKPPVVREPGGTASVLDQLCLDIPADRVEAEEAFWARFTGWDLHHAISPEFSRLVPPPGIPVQLLLQRLDEPRPTSAHLDLACSDKDATRLWHESHGARFVSRFEHWLVMEDPAGATYCLTSRQPETGRLAPSSSPGRGSEPSA